MKTKVTAFTVFIISIAIIVFLAFAGFKGFTINGYQFKTFNDMITKGLDLQGGVSVTMQLEGDNITSKELEQTQQLLSLRVNKVGVSNTSVTTEGNNKVVVNIPGDYDSNSILDTPDKRTMLVNRFKENPSIVDAAFCDNNFIAQSRMGWGREFKGENIQLQVLPVSYNFVKMMGIRMLDGRYFTQDDELKETGIFIINEAAAKQYNITLEDQLYGHVGPAPVVGICEDFHFRPMQYETIPFAFYVMGTKPWRAQRHIYIRLAPGADIQSVKQHVCSVIKELAPNMRNEWMSFNSFDEELGSSYKKESRLSNLITIFSIISIIISLMGVFGLVMFETQYRKHEIGIRRVLGSSIGDILKMFNYKYLKIIAVCFVIAIPVTSYIINEWFKSFAYHTSLHWWVFAVALLIVLAITIVTVTLRSLSAATANPVESIKSE